MVCVALSRSGNDGAAAQPSSFRARSTSIGFSCLGAVLGGLVGGFLVVGVTLIVKAGIGFVSDQEAPFVVVVPLLGLAAAVLVLHGHRTTPATHDEPQPPSWRAFPHEAIRADINADVVDTAGEEERFSWRLAPIRAMAILATVGSGAAMGTEAPAAYLGVAAGAALGDRGKRWRRLHGPAALAGGAAGVSALMGIALVGTVFMLELGRRRRAPLSVERVVAAFVGGFIGWGIDRVFGLGLLRFVVPTDPGSLVHVLTTALLVGVVSGAISSVAGLAVYGAKTWPASPGVRLALGAAAAAMVALLMIGIADPSAAVGPGGGAISWAESADPRPGTLLAVCLLRAGATIAAVAAGGCGGVFVPFLAVGDLAGRVFAPSLGVGSALAGSAGAAAGIAGGYHLPATAAIMVLAVGGPPRAMLTCLATVIIGSISGAVVASLLDRLGGVLSRDREATTAPVSSGRKRAASQSP